MSGLLRYSMNCRGESFLTRRCEHDRALFDGWMPRLGDFAVGAGLLQRRRQRQRQGQHADVGAAGIRELGGLRDVFAEHELASHAIVETLVPEGGHRRPSIRRVLGIRDRDPANATVRQRRESACHVDSGIRSRPQDDAADGVLVEAAAFRRP